MEHLFLGVLKEADAPASRIFDAVSRMDEEKVYRALQQIRGNRRVESENAEAKYQMLQKYARDLTVHWPARAKLTP